MFRGAVVVAVAGLLLALIAALFSGGLRRFAFAYLTNYGFFLSIALGALLFVALQHVSRAGWSVTVRRLAEIMAGTLPILAVLFVPILLFVIVGGGEVFPWAQSDAAAHGHDVVLAKRPYLNAPFFALRWVLYFVIWIGLARLFRLNSLTQDRTGDPGLTRRMEAASAPGLALLGLTLTFASFDLIMSLDPHWFSSIFGVYYFSGAMVGVMAALILLAAWLGRVGLLREQIGVEHRHDMGKWLFAFVFFWGYIAFSQYMLIWYGNLPEETSWFARRGATTVAAGAGPWAKVSLALLLAHFIIPFVGLLSRHVKRSPGQLVFWAGWLLVLHWVDIWWLVMPQYSGDAATFGLPEIGCLLGIGGACVAAMAKVAGERSLVPLRDPRLDEARSFVNT